MSVSHVENPCITNKPAYRAAGFHQTRKCTQQYVLIQCLSSRNCLDHACVP
jgi:hypothetical protein